MADIDELLKGSFERLAEPADSAGVADIIRARVTAGDPGASVAGGVAPGWAELVRPRWLWPLVGVVAGLAAVLVALVAVLVLLPPASPPPVVPSPVVSETVTPEPTPTVTPTPTPVPTAEPEDSPEPPPVPAPPAGDTTAPAIRQISADPTAVGCGNGSTITVVATDDRGVARVDLSWTGPSSGSGTMTQQGGSWGYVVPMSSGTGTYTITAVARDAAGNPSAPAQVAVLRDVCIT